MMHGQKNIKFCTWFRNRKHTPLIFLAL